MKPPTLYLWSFSFVCKAFNIFLGFSLFSVARILSSSKLNLCPLVSNPMLICTKPFFFAIYRSFMLFHPLFHSSPTLSNINAFTIFALYFVHNVFLVSSSRFVIHFFQSFAENCDFMRLLQFSYCLSPSLDVARCNNYMTLFYAFLLIARLGNLLIQPSG